MRSTRYFVECGTSMMACGYEMVSEFDFEAARWNQGDPAKRQPVMEFSLSARKRLRQAVYSYPWHKVGRPVMLTGTWGLPFPACGKTIKVAIKRFLGRWKTRWGTPAHGVWKVEFGEKNGMCHVHFVVGAPRGVEDDELFDWCFGAWLASIGRFDGFYTSKQLEDMYRQLVGMNVSSAYYAGAQDPLRVAGYLIRDLGKQRQNQLPEGFTGMGRWWGVIGGEPRRQVEICCEPCYVQVRRQIRQLYDRQQKEHWAHGKRQRARAIAMGRTVPPNRGYGGADCLRLYEDEQSQEQWCVGSGADGIGRNGSVVEVVGTVLSV